MNAQRAEKFRARCQLPVFHQAPTRCSTRAEGALPFATNFADNVRAGWVENGREEGRKTDNCRADYLRESSNCLMRLTMSR